MAVTLDAIGTHKAAAASTSISYTGLSIGSGLTNAAAVFAIMQDSTTAPTYSSVTYNGSACTQICTVNDGGLASVTWFGIVLGNSPASGTHTFSATASTSWPYYVNGYSFQGVNQTGGTTTFANAQTGSGPPNFGTKTLTVTTSSSDYTVGACFVGTGNTTTNINTLTNNASVTADWVDNAVSSVNGGFASTGHAQVSSGTTITWTATNSSADFGAVAAFDIVAAAATQNPFLNFDFPNPQPVVWYRSWEKFKNPTATVRTNFLNYDFPNPRDPFGEYNSKYRSWEFRNFNITPTVKTTFQQNHWPLPDRGPQRLVDYSWYEAGNNQPPFPTVKTTFQQTDWPLPNTGPQRLSDYAWIWPGNNLTPQPNTATPTNQLDWPNPPPVIWYRSWEKWRQQTPTVKNTFQQNDWPLPQTTSWYRDWNQNLLLTTLTITQAPFRQSDWPLPQILPIKALTWVNGPLTSPSTTQPFSQSDWPNPATILSWYRDWSLNLLETTLFPTGRPFFQTDWPNPQQFPRNALTWVNGPLSPAPSAGNPFVQSNWPLSQSISWYRDWFQNLLETTLSQPVTVIIRQSDWPLPKTVQPIDQFFSQNPLPLQFVLMPFNNVWETVLSPAPIDQFWAPSTLSLLTAPTLKPFNQNDWPNPLPVQWYRDFYNALALFLPPPGKPFSQYDWPLPKSPSSIDETWIQALAALFPPPPPVNITPATGRSYTESELKDYWTKRFVEHTKQQHLVVPPSISAHMAKLGKLSGIARRK